WRSRLVALLSGIQRGPRICPSWLQTFQENLHSTAAGQPHGERVVVVVTERAQFRLAGLDHLKCLGDDSPLDATTRNRSRDLAAFAHRHRGSRFSRSRSKDADDPRQNHTLTIVAPALDIAKQFLHWSFPLSSQEKTFDAEISTGRPNSTAIVPPGVASAH